MSESHVWTVILAAGESARFGGIKAFAPWKDKNFLSQAIDTATEFCGDNLVVVSGAYHDEFKTRLENIRCVYNAEWREGMGSSIACGIREVLNISDQATAIVVLCVDQPYVTAAHLRRLLEKTKETGKCVLSGNGDFSSPPVIVPSAWFHKALELKGDQGLKHCLDDYNTIIAPEVVTDFDYNSESGPISILRKA